MRKEIDKLKDENILFSEVKTVLGTPRLFVNGKEIFPLFAWSWRLEQSIQYFKRAGIHLLHPVLGLNIAWPEPERFDWTGYEELLSRLLKKNPDALFLPRVLLDVPDWWKEKHPDQLVRCALPLKPDDKRQYRAIRENNEGGWLWGIQFKEPSLASDIWQSDMEMLFRAFLQYIESSPLRSRMIGYQIGCGIYGEWHYFLSEFVPDFSEPMREKFDHIPDLKARTNNKMGLFRDPEKEKKTIDYFDKFHQEICADTICHFARIAKEETEGKMIIGTFYGYLLENVWIQEGGHLAPEKILSNPDIDFIASPYSYQTTNIEGNPWWSHDIADDAGNRLGRSRGIAGDGGYRVLLESLKRHNKLFFVELDSSTHLETAFQETEETGHSEIEKELYMVGGEGSTTEEGTKKILHRDLGQIFVNGAGGWLFDFGPVLRTGESWYRDDGILNEVLRFSKLGVVRNGLDMSSCAQIAAVYDAKSLFAIRHWYAESPFRKGATNMDYISTWFLDSQVRAFHRIGAPMDFLYRFDLRQEDLEKYRLLFMVNLFYLDEDKVSYLRKILKDSRATVVWYYAPGFVGPEKLDLKQMERLTGFQFHFIPEPGPMMIHCAINDRDDNHDLQFGVKEHRFPRFTVRDEQADVLGYWADQDEVAIARKEIEGWHSVYIGSAPVPVDILRWLCRQAGADLWSSEPDIVRASQDTAMIVATSDGKRVFQLQKPMSCLNVNTIQRIHHFDMKMGDVKLFIKEPIHLD